MTSVPASLRALWHRSPVSHPRRVRESHDLGWRGAAAAIPPRLANFTGGMSRGFQDIRVVITGGMSLRRGDSALVRAPYERWFSDRDLARRSALDLGVTNDRRRRVRLARRFRFCPLGQTLSGNIRASG